MLDLNKLQEELDKALANETKESLTTWLLEKRKKKKQQFANNNSMKQTFEEAALKCVMFWSDKSFRTSLNQNNGDDSPNAGIGFMLMNMLSLTAQETVTEEKIKKFENKLVELLVETKKRGAAKWEMELDVDYHPSKLLEEAANFAEIDPQCFPCKTWTQIDDDNVATAKYQYGTNPYTL